MVIVGEPASTKYPKTYSEILGQVDKNKWLMAVEVELGNMKRHEVWVVSLKDPGTRGLDTVWVFKRKFDADGRLLKYQAACACAASVKSKAFITMILLPQQVAWLL